MKPLTPSPSIGEIVADSGLSYLPELPFDQVALVMVVHNEEVHVSRLLPYVKPWFGEIVVGVQASTDRTVEIVERHATTVVHDQHRGYGDATFPKLIGAVKAKWSFRIDADEWPEPGLLASLDLLRWLCERDRAGGAWIPFRSWVGGIEWKVPHSHLRFFRTRIGWPGTLHSRPMTDDTYLWDHGNFILHRKTLDEHIRGYLGYYKVGRGNVGWDAHNMAQIEAACRGVAEVDGWDFVKSHEWWPEVRRLVFGDVEPQPISEPIAVEP